MSNLALFLSLSLKLLQLAKEVVFQFQVNHFEEALLFYLESLCNKAHLQTLSQEFVAHFIKFHARFLEAFSTVVHV